MILPDLNSRHNAISLDFRTDLQAICFQFDNSRWGGLMDWPSNLESERRACLESANVARGLVELAIDARGDRSLSLQAAGGSSVAFRDCQRLLLSAADYRPNSGRWANKILALRDQLAGAAGLGLGAVETVKAAGTDRDRAVALYSVLAALADLQLFLSALAQAYLVGGTIAL